MAKIDFNSTATAGTAKDEATVPPLEDYGVRYFNPLLGLNPEETCSNIADVMQLLFEFMRSENIDFEGARPGLKLIVQTIWSASQYTGYCGGYPKVVHSSAND